MGKSPLLPPWANTKQSLCLNEITAKSLGSISQEQKNSLKSRKLFNQKGFHWHRLSCRREWQETLRTIPGHHTRSICSVPSPLLRKAQRASLYLAFFLIYLTYIKTLSILQKIVGGRHRSVSFEKWNTSEWEVLTSEKNKPTSLNHVCSLQTGPTRGSGEKKHHWRPKGRQARSLLGVPALDVMVFLNISCLPLVSRCGWYNVLKPVWV